MRPSFQMGFTKKSLLFPSSCPLGIACLGSGQRLAVGRGVLEEVSLGLMEGEANGPHVLGSVLGGSPWNGLGVVPLLGGVAQRGQHMSCCKQCSYGFGVGAFGGHVGVWAVECLRNVASGGRSACRRLLLMPPHRGGSGARPFPLSAWRG